VRDVHEDREGRVSAHDWRQLLQVGRDGSTDTVEQCRKCGVVRHVYGYATLERHLSTVRSFVLAETVPTDDECRGLLAGLPEATDVASSVEPVL
jgi:hypothetical protein